MAIQVVEPFGRSFERMKWILFQPFDLGKWFVIGFTAFLANLGRGGAGGGGGGHAGGNMNFGPQHPVELERGGLRNALPPELLTVWDWCRDHAGLVILIVVAVVTVILVLSVVFIWLQSRGKFMFLDNVVFNRAAVREPWRRFRRQANRLFGFRLILFAVALLLWLIVLGLGVLVALPDILSRTFEVRAVMGIVVTSLLGVPLALTLAVLGFVVESFVVPTMYVRGAGVGEAFGIFRREVLPGRLGTLVCYLLFRFVLSIAGGLIVLVAGCMTCCVGLLPYLSSVLALPVTVTLRLYSLYFLQQFGEGFRFFAEPALTLPVLSPAPGISPAPFA